MSVSAHPSSLELSKVLAIRAEMERAAARDWEATQHLIHALDQCGETGAAELLAKLRDRAENYRDLAYRFYLPCDRKGWTQDAIAYNSLILSWPEMNRLVSQYASNQDQSIQTTLNVST